MKLSKVFIFVLAVFLLASAGAFVRVQLSSGAPKKQLHPLQLLPAVPDHEAISLRKAKDLITYRRENRAIALLSTVNFNLLKCWEDYFENLALARLGKKEGWEGLLNLPSQCPARKLALEYLLENAPQEFIGRIPPGELKGEEAVELAFKLGKLDKRTLYCDFPALAEKFRVKIKRPSAPCRKKRFAYFMAKGLWSKAYREATTRFQRARASFYARKYRRTIVLLRRTKKKEEVLLLFRTLLRAGYVERARRMKPILERKGLGEEYLWKMAMFYYPEERGFSLFKDYLSKYPKGKYSQQAENYLLLRKKCLDGEDVKGETLNMVPFSLPSPKQWELPFIKRAGLLSSAFLFKEAERELEYALEKKPSPLLKYYLGVVYYRAGKYLKGLKTIISVFNGLPNDPLTLKMIYPFPMRRKIEKLSLANGIDPFLIAALIHQESLFRPDAHSYAGAVGLLQLTKNTFASTVRRMGGGFSNPWDGDENLQVGIRHFSELVNYYDGVVEYALAAYNAGIQRVDRWRKYLPCRKANTFVELIPISQTRNYVRAIKRKWKIYRRLYDKGGSSLWRQVLGTRDLHNIRQGGL